MRLQNMWKMDWNRGDVLTLSSAKAGRFLTHWPKLTMFENTAEVLISASVYSGVPRPIRNILFERFNLTWHILSYRVLRLCLQPATSYPISPEFSNPQDLTTPDSDFSLSDNNKIAIRAYIPDPSMVKLIMNRLVHRYYMKNCVFSYKTLMSRLAQTRKDENRCAETILQRFT